MFLFCTMANLQNETVGPCRPQVEEEWFPRIAQGEAEAFRLLYEETHQALYGYLLSIIKRPSDAEDVLQDTYLRIRANAGRYQPQGKPLAWVFTIARNLALMKLRTESKTTPLAIDNVAEHPYFADGEGERLLERLVLEGAFQILSPEERQIVMLHAVAGFKHREIAGFLDMPLASVLSKYARSLKKLKRYLAAKE